MYCSVSQINNSIINYKQSHELAQMAEEAEAGGRHRLAEELRKLAVTYREGVFTGLTAIIEIADEDERLANTPYALTEDD